MRLERRYSIYGLLIALAVGGCARSAPKDAANTPATTVDASPKAALTAKFGRLYARLISGATPTLNQLGLAAQPVFIGLLTTFDTDGTTTDQYTLRVGNAEWDSVERASGQMLRPGSPITSLSGKVHLVRVTISSGESGANAQLRVKDVVRLDGTPDAPFDVENIFGAFFNPYLETTPQQQNLSQQLAKALDPISFDSTVDGHGPPPVPISVMIPERKSLRENAPTGARSKTGSVSDRRTWGTWIPATKSLKMVVWMSRTDLWSGMVPNPRAGEFGCEAPPGADCAPHAQPEEIQKMRTFQAEIAVVGTYSASTGRTEIQEIPVEVHEKF